MTLPQNVVLALADQAYRRTSPGLVELALTGLGVEVPPGFREFYDQYEGPFGSDITGFQLLDLCSGDPCIVSSTEFCRSQYGFPARYLVLTEILGGAVLVCDVDTDQVYDVDFEGGEVELLAGRLSPKWESFAAFLEEFFG